MDIMTSHTSHFLSAEEMCARVKSLGYAARQRIRLYGEEFEVVSDPFPDGDGIAVSVTTDRATGTRTLRLPAAVVHSVKGRLPNAA